MHVLPGAASAASVEAFCAQHLPWRSASTQERGAASHGEASRTAGVVLPTRESLDAILRASADADEEVIDFDEDGTHDEL